MDHGVAMVEAYLRVNGFLTAVEYPILERGRDGKMREATELDVLAYRSAAAGRAAPQLDMRGKLTTHAPLDIEPGRAEWIIGEVKEGAAGANPGLLRTGTLREVLRRYGVVPRDELKAACRAIRNEGQYGCADGTRVRLVLFAVRGPERPQVGQILYIGDVADFLETYVQQHVEGGGATRFRDPVLGQMALREKTLQ